MTTLFLMFTVAVFLALELRTGHRIVSGVGR